LRYATPLIIAVAGLVGIGIAMESSRRLETATTGFRERAIEEAKLASGPAESGLRSIYENLRTISALPGVRGLDDKANALSDESRETVQQIYNNLASAVAVSEVYVVGAGFDPERIDAATGKPQEPIVMFDELIVDAAKRLPASAQERLTESSREEVEIHEYRELARQIAWFRDHFPNRNSFAALDTPVLASASLITCDNTQFVHSGKDADRSGTIFSVPFYRQDGTLGGVVSAIILDRALARLLPEHAMALVNEGYGYSVGLSAADRAKPQYLVSETIPLAARDSLGEWRIWSGRTQAEFDSSPEAVAARTFRAAGLAIDAGLLVVALGMARLGRRREEEVRQQAEHLERAVAERTAEIAHIAGHDQLTGLVNRSFLDAHLKKIADDGPDAARYAILCIDLDDFKRVNDTLGHNAGDDFLREVAQRMAAAIGPDDVAARWGGDEFVVVHMNAETAEDVDNYARHIVDTVCQPLFVEGKEFRPRMSIGYAASVEIPGLPATLMRKADVALYHAKADGNGVCRRFTPDLEAEYNDRRQFERELRTALDRDEFVVFYQPVVEIPSGTLHGFEALVRWRHPTRGLVPPIEFIPVAEKNGMIVEIGYRVLQKACTTAASWPSHLGVAVNLSPLQMRQPSLALNVMRALEKSGLEPHRLELEITETVIMFDTPETRQNLQAIHDLGVRLSLDDFGTGYSSLSYLKTFPFDRIKIDRSFVRDLAERPDSLAIVKAVTALAGSLGMATTAEGVETVEQLDLLVSHGSRAAQGYLFGKPMPEEDAGRLAAATRTEARKRA
jgi:diguanylate cyclase (GGDEF)-like protein